jgi:hypothetical protein
MKYLYKILRLFMCPHKYVEERSNRLKCKYCGKIKNVRCKHEYKIIDEARGSTSYGPIFVFVSRCNSCGHIKSERCV